MFDYKDRYSSKVNEKLKMIIFCTCVNFYNTFFCHNFNNSISKHPLYDLVCKRFCHYL